MISFENVRKTYGDNVALDNVTINIDKGEFVFLVGPSGAGKTTFIKLILKEIDPDQGSITVGHFKVSHLSKREIPTLRRRIGMVFQDFRLLPKKTVFENVAFAMEILHKSKRQIRKRVPQILTLVGIADKADKYPSELSAGEQQRVAIARAVINNPTVLIADEPTGNLDPDTARGIMALLEEINATGTTILMVTHAKDIVDEMKKRVIAIEDGKVVRDEKGQYGYQSQYQDEDDSEVDILESTKALGKHGKVISEDSPFLGESMGEAKETEEAPLELGDEAEKNVVQGILIQGEGSYLDFNWREGEDSSFQDGEAEFVMELEWNEEAKNDISSQSEYDLSEAEIDREDDAPEDDYLTSAQVDTGLADSFHVDSVPIPSFLTNTKAEEGKNE